MFLTHLSHFKTLRHTNEKTRIKGFPLHEPSKFPIIMDFEVGFVIIL